MDRGACRATVDGVAKGQTGFGDYTTTATELKFAEPQTEIKYFPLNDSWFTKNLVSMYYFYKKTQ